MKILLAAVGGYLVGIAIGISAALLLDPTTIAPAQLPACATEDQEIGPCYWDGGKNQKGSRFWVDSEGAVHYL